MSVNDSMQVGCRVRTRRIGSEQYYEATVKQMDGELATLDTGDVVRAESLHLIHPDDVQLPRDRE